MAVDDRATEALGHVQRAVLEMIEAARAALDLVEDMVADPQSLAAVVAEAGRLAGAVVAAISASERSGTGAGPGGAGPVVTEAAVEPEAGEQTPPRWVGSGVEHIPVT